MQQILGKSSDNSDAARSCNIRMLHVRTYTTIGKLQFHPRSPQEKILLICFQMQIFLHIDNFAQNLIFLPCLSVCPSYLLFKLRTTEQNRQKDRQTFAYLNSGQYISLASAHMLANKHVLHTYVRTYSYRRGGSFVRHAAT